MSVKSDTRRWFSLSLEYKGFLLWCAPTIQLSIVDFLHLGREKARSHSISFYSRTFIWFSRRDFIDDSLCPRWSRKKCTAHILVCVFAVRHTILAHRILMVWSNFIGTSSLKWCWWWQRRNSFEIYTTHIVDATGKKSTQKEKKDEKFSC